MKVKLKIEVAEQTVVLLEELAKMGVYGEDAEEVAARFVEQRVAEFIRQPIWSVTGETFALITKKEKADDTRTQQRQHPRRERARDKRS